MRQMSLGGGVRRAGDLHRVRPGLLRGPRRKPRATRANAQAGDVHALCVINRSAHPTLFYYPYFTIVSRRQSLRTSLSAFCVACCDVDLDNRRGKNHVRARTYVYLCLLRRRVPILYVRANTRGGTNRMLFALSHGNATPRSLRPRASPHFMATNGRMALCFMTVSCYLMQCAAERRPRPSSPARIRHRTALTGSGSSTSSSSNCCGSHICQWRQLLHNG